MAAIDFPNAPTIGQQFTAPAGQTYTWTGEAWLTGGSATGVVTWNSRAGNVVMTYADITQATLSDPLATDAELAAAIAGVGGTAASKVSKAGDTMTGSLTLPLGTINAPALLFAGDADTGVYSSAPGQFTMVVNGVDRLTFGNSGMTGNAVYRGPFGSAAAPAYAFSAESGLGVWRAAASTLGFSTGGVNRLSISATAVTSTLPVALPANPTLALEAAPKQYVDLRVEKTDAGTTGAAKLPAGTTAQQPGTPLAGFLRFNTETGKFEGHNGTVWGAIGGGAAVGTAPPSNPGPGDFWWSSELGILFVYYNDGNTSQWISTSSAMDPTLLVKKSGDTMTGALDATGLSVAGNAVWDAGNLSSPARQGALNTFGNFKQTFGTGTSVGGDFVNVGGTGVPVGIECSHAGGAGANLGLNRSASDGWVVAFYRGGTGVGSIAVTPSNTAYNNTSDERVKRDLKPWTGLNAFFDAVQIHDFEWIREPGKRGLGVIAQQLVTIAPEAVTPGPEPDDMWGVDYSKLVPHLIAGMQQLRARVTAMEALAETPSSHILTNANVGFTLPAGGKWLWFGVSVTSNGRLAGDTESGVSDGGTTILPPIIGQHWTGFYRRVA